MPSSTIAAPRRRRLTAAATRRTAALAAAALVAFGATATVSGITADSASAMPKVQMCWYKGYFLQDGQWYYGLFKEPC